MNKPLMLMILDGYGESACERGNAVRAARTPNIDRLKSRWNYTLIEASGESVGLPAGQIGNSEVGHTNIGAGRIVWQELTKISKDIRDGDFFENAELLSAMNTNGGALHLMGLLSDGGVHSHIEHLYALLRMAKEHGVERVYIHAFLDGRDVPPESGADFVRLLRDKCAEIGIGKIAHVIGRYYGMDRDNRYERLILAYNALVKGEGEINPDPVAAVENSYANGVTDEFVLPVVSAPEGTIKAGDSLIFFNFRPDRAREITRSLVDDDFTGFERESGRIPLNYVCFTQYDATIPNVSVAFKPQSLDDTFGQYLADNGLTQLRIAETEKYAHVTFFFNGGRELQYAGEDRILVKSPSVATYDMQPEMSAYEVTDKVIEAVESDKYDVIILNFANCDMVGHTGVFDAAVKAVEAVDECVGRVSDAVISRGGIMLMTADHGNAEKMMDEDGNPFTAHTTNPVIFLVAGKETALREGGVLADIAPTMLKLLDMPKPELMTGTSIVL